MESEEPEIKSKQASKRDRTLHKVKALHKVAVQFTDVLRDKLH